MKPKYALHPGPVYRPDGDVHHITAPQLAMLYRLPRGSWVDWSSRNALGLRVEEFIHLYPRSNGDYVLPGNDREPGKE